jgi:hypothetical protein
LDLDSVNIMRVSPEKHDRLNKKPNGFLPVMISVIPQVQTNHEHE